MGINYSRRWVSFRIAENLTLNDHITEHWQPAYKPVSRTTIRCKIMHRFLIVSLNLLNILKRDPIYTYLFIVIFGVITPKRIRTWVLHVIELMSYLF